MIGEKLGDVQLNGDWNIIGYKYAVRWWFYTHRKTTKKTAFSFIVTLRPVCIKLFRMFFFGFDMISNGW